MTWGNRCPQPKPIKENKMTFNKLLDTAFLNEIAKATNAGFQAGVKWQK